MKLVSFVKPMALLAVLACFFAVGCGGETAPVAPEQPVVIEGAEMEMAPVTEEPAVTEEAADAS